MAIAREKAGIIKRDVPVICAEQAPRRSPDRTSVPGVCMPPLHTAGRSGINVERGRLPIRTIAPDGSCGAKTFGRHPIDNAGLRLPALRALDAFQTSRPRSKQALVNAEWPARCSVWCRAGSWIRGRRAAKSGSMAPQREGGRVVAAAWASSRAGVSPLVVMCRHDGDKDAVHFSPISRPQRISWRSDTGSHNAIAAGQVGRRRPRGRIA